MIPLCHCNFLLSGVTYSIYIVSHAFNCLYNSGAAGYVFIEQQTNELSNCVGFFCCCMFPLLLSASLSWTMKDFRQ